MTRRSWLLFMLFGLLLTFGGAVQFYNALTEKQSMATVPLTQIKKPVPVVAVSSSTAVAAPAVAASSAAAVASASPVETKSPEPAASPSSGAKRNVTFSYRSSLAKEVFIICDYNDWHREPMKKQAHGIWRTTLKLAPGKYEYLYVVDGRRTKDPNPISKKLSDADRNIITVKPPAKK